MTVTDQQLLGAEGPLSSDAGAEAAPLAPPTSTERAAMFAHCFAGQANHLAAQFGGQLWLVGSMLTSLTPGDIDLRLAITREDLVDLFGDDNIDCTVPWGASSYRRAREELKVSRRMTRRWCIANRTSRPTRHWATRVDFQFWICLFNDDGNPIGREEKPRLRLDTLPLGFLDAGRGEP